MSQDTLYAAPEDDAPPAGRRKVVLAVGAGGLLALGAGAFLLLGTGGADAPVTTAVARPAAVRPVPVVPAPAAAAPAAGQPAAGLPAGAVPAVAHPGRNPFLALYRQPAAAAPAAAPAAPAAPAPSAPSSVPSSAPATAPAPAPVAPQAPVPVAPPVVPAPATTTVTFAGVQGTGEGLAGLFVVDGAPRQALVGAVLVPGGDLTLVSLQEGPARGEWTAVLRRGTAAPFDLALGRDIRLH